VDVADIMRYVRATNQHQIILPDHTSNHTSAFSTSSSSLHEVNSSDPTGRVCDILISPRSVLSCAANGALNFVSRTPPHTTLSANERFSWDFGELRAAALTHDPFVDQAIIVSSGKAKMGVQASLLDFRAKEVGPP
jgi:hypothetical protein